MTATKVPAAHICIRKGEVPKHQAPPASLRISHQLHSLDLALFLTGLQFTESTGKIVRLFKIQPSGELKASA
jgi:hypothetical protein